MTSPLKTPVVFMVFNRPNPTQIVFDSIAKARPETLLIVADGPRADKPTDVEGCRQVREIVKRVDWPCDVQTNFSESNLGCRERVISGLNWAFSLVEEAIILEDDCLPNSSFFPFCSELLERYRNDSRVAMISGDNFIESAVKTEYSYYFSRVSHIWGWATWRTAWARYDRHLSSWPEIRDSAVLGEIFDDPLFARYWTQIFDSVYNDSGPKTWDYQWAYATFINSSLCIVPRVNLITNIGFGPDATHTTDADSANSLASSAVGFPLKHPPTLIPLRSMDAEEIKHNLFLSLSQRVQRKVRRLWQKLG